jgi:hypothetical protein
MADLQTVLLDTLGNGLTSLVDKAIRVTALEVERDSKLRMRGAKSGMTYRRRGVLHRASARGESPAVDTGALRASIGVRRAGIAAYDVFTGAQYAFRLQEFMNRPIFTGLENDALERMTARIQGVIERGK